MARERYKPEEIVAKLRQVDVLVSQGQNMVDAIRHRGEDWRHGSSDAAGLGDPVQRAGSGRSHQYSFSGDAAQAQRRT